MMKVAKDTNEEDQSSSALSSDEADFVADAEEVESGAQRQQGEVERSGKEVENHHFFVEDEQNQPQRVDGGNNNNNNANEGAMEEVAPGETDTFVERGMGASDFLLELKVNDADDFTGTFGADHVVLKMRCSNTTTVDHVHVFLAETFHVDADSIRSVLSLQHPKVTDVTSVDKSLVRWAPESEQGWNWADWNSLVWFDGVNQVSCIHATFCLGRDFSERSPNFLRQTEPSKMGRKEPKLPPFAVVWGDVRHHNDGGCFVLFRSLQASYDLLDWTVAILEKTLLSYLGSFVLQVRGSVGSRTALKTKADIDVDVLLPAHVCTFESIRQQCHNMGSLQPLEDICKTLYGPMQSLTKSREVIAVNKRKRKDKNTLLEERWSRSLKLTFTVHGYTFDVDVFPKFIDVDGFVRCLSSEQENGTRVWSKTSWLPQSSLERVNRYESEVAAVLLLKLWKYSLGPQLSDCVKGYHIAVCSAEIIRQEEEKKSRKAKKKDFIYEHVVVHMFKIAKFLSLAYVEGNRTNFTVLLDNVTGLKSNPFLGDNWQYLALLGNVVDRLRLLCDDLLERLRVMDVIDEDIANFLHPHAKD